jgi:hypothetical protein
MPKVCREPFVRPSIFSGRNNSATIGVANQIEQMSGDGLWMTPHFDSGGAAFRFFFALPLEAAPPMRPISDRRSGLSAFARA